MTPARFRGLQARPPVAMEITDARPQVAASPSSRTTSPRPSSPSHLRTTMMMSLAWTLTWTPWKRHPTANLCPSPSTTWKVKFSSTSVLCGISLIAALTSRRPAASRRCVAASERRALQPQVQVGFSGRFWFWIRSRPVWTGSSGAGGHGGQTGHQMALFLHW